MLVLLAFPVLAAALLVLEIDRRLGAQVFAANSGGAILWQNLFWFFGHPEVYILALPFFGIATEILPVFSRKPLFGYKTLIAATIAIAGLSMTVWAHHMFTTGAVLLPFFSFMSFLIAIPTGIKFFNWIGTMWHGQLTFEPPMLYSIGFLITFLFGGITGIILASPPLDFAVSDSYFVVSGGAILWQNLFWFFGHPEVYILALPFFGIATEILPVFSRKPLFGYKTLIAATIAIAGLSMTVWAHHMFTTGAVLLPFFSFMTLLIAVPTGVKFFNWAGTMWRGQLSFEPPMLYTIGFLVVFLFGGITGIILASPPLDFAVSDSYFVVAHFHYVLAGTVLFEMFAGLYFWWPKMTGKMLNSSIGKVQFWLLFIGFNMTFLVQHWAGVQGQVRRTANYPFLPGDVTTLNVISTVGSWLLALSVLLFIWNVYTTTRFGQKVTEEDPWGYSSSLEWATSCPPPRHNFYRIPRIRSERPAFEAHYPHIKAGVASKGVEQTIPALSAAKK